MYVAHLGLYVHKLRHLGVCLYGFEMDISERVHFKVLFFYILQHFTLTGGLGVIKEAVMGVGGPPIQPVLSHCMPMGDFG